LKKVKQADLHDAYIFHVFQLVSIIWVNFHSSICIVIHIHSLNDFHLQNAWLTIGIFDGVHRGHQRVLRALVDGAHAAGNPAVVMTFDPHPAVVLGSRKNFKYLTTPEERLALFNWLGVDTVITQAFSREFANQTAGDFMQLVMQHLQLSRLVIGYDTAIGRNREGNAGHLEMIGEDLGFSVQVIPPLSDNSGIVSSTRIRQAIREGRMAAARENLGRYFDLTGTILHGDGRGHRIKIPTANVQVPVDKIIPANGIYACWAWIKAADQKTGEQPDQFKKYAAATNVGVRPTFTPDLPSPLVEAHLLDFKGDLYGQKVRLEFVEYLRPEEIFVSVQALVRQIQADIELTKQVILKVE
jgi:riboflavin kinase/FMN adenylyltransferase